MRVVIVHNEVPAGAAADDQDTLVQAVAVADAMRRLGHETTVLACTLDLESLRRQLHDIRAEAVFNLVESLGGSDRLLHVVPALLDALGLPYTGAPTEALVCTSNKLLAKRWLRGAGLPTPDWFDPVHEQVSAGAGRWQNRQDPSSGTGIDASPGTYIIKTVLEHGSFGLDDDLIVAPEQAADLPRRVADVAARLGRPCFAERFIEGREFNLSLLASPPAGSTGGTASRVAVRPADRAGSVEVLPPAEIEFLNYPAGKPRVVGYRAKWSADSFEFDHTPRRFDFSASDAALLERLASLARQCWVLFGLRGYARVDFRVDADGDPWILEINANPCLSPDAGFAAALARTGVEYQTAIDRILADALAAPCASKLRARAGTR